MTGVADRSTPPVKQPAGFTLVEVLVAFTILSLALSALFGSFSTGLSAGRRAADKSFLFLSGRSILSEVGVSIDLVPGEITGELADGTPWVLTIDEFQPLEEELLSSLTVNAYRVELIFRRNNAEAARLVTMKLSGASEIP